MQLNLARFRASDSARFSNSHGTLTSWIVLRNLSKHVKTTCGFVNIARKAEIARWKVFFSAYTTSVSPFRSDLNSSLARSAGEWWPFRKGVFSIPLGFVGAEIFTNFWCFVHNFGYRYARKSFKGSKDADFGLVSTNNLSQKNGPMGWGPGPAKSGHKKQKHPHLQRSSQRTPNRKRKTFCFDFD